MSLAAEVAWNPAIRGAKSAVSSDVLVWADPGEG